MGTDDLARSGPSISRIHRFSDYQGGTMGTTIVLIGTRKGLAIARSTDDRRSWSLDDLHFSNQEVYSVAADSRRDPPRIFAGVGTGHWGPLLTYSDDLGQTWTEPAEPPIGFPTGSDAAVERVW